MTLETFEDGDFVSYTYNSYGNLATVTDSIKISPTETIQTTTTYYYDLLDRMVKYREVSTDTDHTVTYEYDAETQLYYLQSRYYSPEIGRFLNADAFASTGQGPLGNNMFAYCLNSPVNKIDSSGEEAYDLFDSPDDAALDFAICYNAKSIEDKQEYGSAIFMYSYIETRTVVNTFTFRLFGKTFKFNYYTTYDVLVTKYYYNKPAVGRDGYSVIPNLFGIGTIVSTVHTHANCTGANAEVFSDPSDYGVKSDIGWSNLFRMNSYMVTPGGYLKKYTYKNRKDANGGVTVIPGNIPWDPNCTHRIQ